MSTPKKTDADAEWESLEYISGFGNHCRTEALPNTLPQGQNSPQHVARGLYAEQLQGSAFTCPRATNQRSWLYRIAPSVCQGGYSPAVHAEPPAPPPRLTASFPVVDPTPMRWRPMALPAEGATVDFVDGLSTMCGAGGPQLKEGVAIHIYACNAPMTDRAFCNADGDLLLVPQVHVTVM